MNKFTLILFCALISASYAFSCDHNFLAKMDESEIKTIKEEWAQLVKDNHALPWGNSDFEYKQFINPKLFERYRQLHAQKTKNGYDLENGYVEFIPLRIYPRLKQQYRSYLKAKSFLEKKSTKDFVLTEELINSVHKIATKNGYSKLSKNLPSQIKALNPLIKKALSDEQLAQIKRNPYLNFVEFPKPLSKIDKRKGLLLFPRNPKKELRSLITWFEKSKDKINIVTLAAIFQQRFISIQPYYKGSYIVAKLIANKVLSVHGLPPSTPTSFLSPSDILYSPAIMSQSKWVEVFSKGIKNSLKLFKDEFSTPEFPPELVPGHAKGTIVKVEELPNLSDEFPNIDEPFSDFPQEGDVWDPIDMPDNGDSFENTEGHFFGGGDLNSFSVVPSMIKHRSLKTRLKFYKDKKVYRDQKFFRISHDGFIHDELGIPYVFRDNTLYPISDLSAISYSKEHSIPHHQYLRLERQGRLINPEYKQIIENNLIFISKSKNQIDSSIKIINSKEIVKVNDKYDYHFYSWQKNLLRKNLKYDLERFKLELGTRQSAAFPDEDIVDHQNHLRKASKIIAEYVHMYIEGIKKESYLRLHFPDLLPLHKKTQNQIFSISKKLVQETLETLSKGNEDIEVLNNIQKYFNYSPLFYDTYKSARINLGENIYLLRSDADIISKIGFLPVAIVQRLFNSTPYASRLMSYLKKHSELLKKNWPMYSNKLLTFDKFDITINEALTRMTRMMHDHTTGDNKYFTSFSSNIYLYLYNNFKANENFKYKVFLAKKKVKDVIVNPSLIFSEEYEVLTNQYTSPFQLKDTFSIAPQSALAPDSGLKKP